VRVLWARLALVVGSVVLTLGVLEVGLVLVGYEDLPLSIEINDEADARAYHMFEDGHFVPDPDLIWRPRTDDATGTFNSQGFRGPELATAKPPGQIRVFAVGDSNTLGWAGPEGAHWPRDLQDQIDAPDVVVVNAGVWGYASLQGLVRFRQTLAYDPDVALISFASNDAHLVLQSDREYLAGTDGSSPLVGALRRFRLGQLVLSAFEGAAGGDDTALRPRVSLEEYRANVVQIIEEGRDRGVDIVLLTRPYIGEIDDPFWWKNQGADYQAATIEIAEAMNVMVIDLYSFFRGRDELFADESHFTEEGHRRAAALVLESLRPLLEARR